MKEGLIIAICGESGAGKSTTTEILKSEGFVAYSLSGFLRAEAEAAIGTPTRIEVQQHGKSMQEAHGNDYYARLLDDNTDLFLQSRAVIDGMRNGDELAYLRQRAAAAGVTLKLLALVLDSESRFRRVTGRGRAGDPGEFAQFAADDARANGAEGDFQNNQALIAMADWRIENTGEMADLQSRLRQLIDDRAPVDPAPVTPQQRGANT